MIEPRRKEPREGSGWGPVTVQGLQQHKGRQYRADPADPAPKAGKIAERIERMKPTPRS